MKYTTISLLVIISFLLSSCGAVKNGNYSIKQGVFGKVVWIQGNMMPSPDLPVSGNGKSAQRMIKIYEHTNFSQVNGEAPLFVNVNTKLIKTIKSDRNGYYQAKLLPGKYSIFTLEEDGKLFANLFDGEGLISAFEVKTNEVVTFDIKINYKAHY
jgi:hypothetical protein